MAKAWFVLETYPAKEFAVDNAVKARTFQSYLPLQTVEYRRRDHTLYSRLLPLLAGYVFVRFNPKRDTWKSLASLEGVKRFLGYRETSSQPLAVANEEIVGLKRYLREHKLHVDYQTLGARKTIPPETLVLILSGAFRDHSAHVVADNGSRIEVMLTLLGRETSLKLPRECFAVAA